jgi:D-3-phosphoglycerate dehydrogenase
MDGESNGMKRKILITPRSFGKTDKSVFDLFRNDEYEVVINPYGQILTKEQMIENVRDKAGVIVGVDPFDRDVIEAAPDLKAIAKYGVGTDNIDTGYAKLKGIPVSITAGANTNAVADYTFALMLAVARRITLINGMCHEKNWTKVIGSDVYGKTLGILGLGAIGKAVAKRAKGFDMKVLAYDIYRDDEYAEKNNIIYSTLQNIFKTCDFISLHLPLTNETRNIINETTLSSMKPNCILINTARGGLIDEPALIKALKNGVILGAGLDVFNSEPPEDDEIYQLDNLIMSSHSAASTNGASEQMSYLAAINLLNDLKKSL